MTNNRARARAHVRDLACVLLLAFARVLDRASAHLLSRAHAHGLARVLALDLASARVLVNKRSRVLHLDLNHVLALDHVLDRAHTLAHDLISDLDSDRSLDLARDLGRGLDLARDLDRKIEGRIAALALRANEFAGILAADGSGQASEAGLDAAPVVVSKGARRLAGCTARLLPVQHQARMAEEFFSELYDIAASGGSRRRQIGHALRVLVYILPLRRALSGSRCRAVDRG